MEAALCIHTCLWLGAAWVPPASAEHGAEPRYSTEPRHGTKPRHGTLSWAVSLDAPEEQLEQRAEELARSAGLLNMGRVGELRGHYLFTSQPDGRAPEAIRRSVDTLFAQHDSVRWHSEQKLLKRSKRSLRFNDPKYPQQWHLVSGFLAPAVPARSGCLRGRRGDAQGARSAHHVSRRRQLPWLAPHWWHRGGQRGFGQGILHPTNLP